MSGYFDLGGTASLGDTQTTYGDPFGGDGVSLSEAATQAAGPYGLNSNDTAGSAGILFARDAVEQQRMQAGYPLNGQGWDFNAAVMGVSRLIDSGARAYATVNGSQAVSYAGQNGLTYANGRGGVQTLSIGSNLMPLLIIGAIVYALAK